MELDMSAMTTLAIGFQLFLPHEDILLNFRPTNVGIRSVAYSTGRFFSRYLARSHVASFGVRFVKIRVRSFSAPCRSVDVFNDARKSERILVGYWIKCRS